MTDKIFKVLEEINAQGIDNSEWGVTEDVDTKNYFGAEDPWIFNLNGKWLYVWTTENPKLENLNPDLILHLEFEERITLWNLD